MPGSASKVRVAPAPGAGGAGAAATDTSGPRAQATLGSSTPPISRSKSMGDGPSPPQAGTTPWARRASEKQRVANEASPEAKGSLGAVAAARAFGRVRKDYSSDGPRIKPRGERDGELLDDSDEYLVKLKHATFCQESIEFKVNSDFGGVTTVAAMLEQCTPVAEGSGRCTWVHCIGVCHNSLAALQTRFKFPMAIISASEMLQAKPGIEWEEPLDEDEEGAMVVIAQQLSLTKLADEDDEPAGHHAADGEATPTGGPTTALATAAPTQSITALEFEADQVSYICIPSTNTIISLQYSQIGDCSEDCITRLMCSRGKLRRYHHWSQILAATMDGSVDSLYPLMEIYGDALEELDLTMMRSQKPTAEHVNTSHLIKQRLQNIRRYAWECRHLVTDMQQDEFDVLPEMGTAERAHVDMILASTRTNTCETTEMCDAWRARCGGVDDFYEQYHDKKMNDALFVLTVASVVTMPITILTGLYGMNFAKPEDGAKPPSMPELAWDYGYVYFWTLACTLTLLVSGLLWRAGMLDTLSAESVSDLLQKDARYANEMAAKIAKRRNSTKSKRKTVGTAGRTVQANLRFGNQNGKHTYGSDAESRA